MENVLNRIESLEKKTENITLISMIDKLTLSNETLKQQVNKLEKKIESFETGNFELYLQL